MGCDVSVKAIRMLEALCITSNFRSNKLVVVWFLALDLHCCQMNIESILREEEQEDMLDNYRPW